MCMLADAGGVFPLPRLKVWKSASLNLYPDEGTARQRTAALRRAPSLSWAPSSRWGLGTFLIVGDFIQWAKNNGCPCGPGQGRAQVRWWPTPLKITVWTRWNTTRCLSVFEP